LELDYGQNTDTSLTLSYMEDFMRYSQNPTLNDDLSHVYLDAAVTRGAAIMSAHLAYDQNYTNNPTFITPTTPVDTIIRSDTETADGKLDYNFSEKFYAGGDMNFLQTEYQGGSGAVYQNSDSYTVPLHAYYSYSPKLDIGVVYSFNYTQQQTAFRPQPPVTGSFGRNRYTNDGGLSVKIKQWEKVTGTVDVGITSNHVDSAPGTSAVNNTAFYYDMKLQYDLSQKLSFYLNGANNYFTGAAGQNIEETSANFTGHYAYSDFVYFDANFIGYTYSQYLGPTTVGGGRRDNTYTSGFSANWTPTSYLLLTAAYSYFMNSSNTAGATYNINLISVSGSIRY
jgi:hypothetical protein